MRTFASLLAPVALLSASSVASAQSPPQELRLPLPGRTLATGDDSSALARNPANVGFLPKGELRWTFLHTSDGAVSSSRGHVIEAATPLFWGLAIGARLDYVRPPIGAFAPGYSVGSFALAFKPAEAFSIGMSWLRTTSSDPLVDAISGGTFGVTIRPMKYFALAGVLREGTQDGYRGTLYRAWDLGVALRPLGTRAFELGVEASKAQISPQWTPRGVLGVAIPYVGRLRGDISIENPNNGATPSSYVATAGLDVDFPAGQIAGGGMFGSGLGSGQGGLYTSLAVRGFTEGGIPARHHYVKVRIDDTPGDRAHVRLLRNLWRVADAPDIDGVALVLKSEPASSMAHAEELGDAIRMLRSRGKKVFCHLEDAGGRALYACSQADRTVMNPAGGLRFAGLRLQWQYFGEALNKLGVRVDIVRIGAHKGAAEEFTRSSPSETADADHRDLLEQYSRQYLADVGGGRRISAPELALTLSKGPFLAREAREARLIDGYAYDDEVDAVAAEMNGAPIPVRELSSSPAFRPAIPDEMGERERVAIVYVEGTMVDGNSRDIPFIGMKIAGSRTIAAAVKAAHEDPRVRSIVLRVESPGGSSMAADVIWREVSLAARDKPVIVSMGSTAASGGYYVAAPGNVIFANRATMTGSIGIFYGKADVADLFSRIGITTSTYRQTPRADAESMYRPYTEEERQELGRKVKGFYEVFVDRVARGRGMTADQVDAVARGRVWTGAQAVEHKLVDRIGGLREALDEAKKRGGLGRNAMIVELPAVPTSLLGYALSLAGVAEARGENGEPLEPSFPIPRELVTTGRVLYPFFAFDGMTPMMQLEGAPEAP